MEKYICELRNAIWWVSTLIEGLYSTLLYSNRSWATTVRKIGPHHWYNDYLSKTDTIVDFLQMIFKIIIQNLQTSNAASQNNSHRQHQKKLRIFEKGKARGGWDFPKTKARDIDVILSPSFPHCLYRQRTRTLHPLYCKKTLRRNPPGH